MGILDDVKSRLKQLADKAPEFRDEALDKIKKYSEDGVEITRDLFADISNQVSEITASTRLQYAIKDLENNLKKAYRNLGELGFSAYLAAKNPEHLDQMFGGHIEIIENIKSEITKKTTEYNRYKKEKSDNYIINKFSEELTQAGAVIDQVFVSEKSNVTGKLLKEILLPKEALISAIKRGNEIIIPDGNTQFLSGDLVTVFGKENDVKKVIKRLSTEK